MKSNEYEIKVLKNQKELYSVKGERLCQAIKKFIGYCVSNRWVKKKNLIGYFIRNRIITRYELGVFFFDPDTGKEESSKKVK